MERSFLDYEDRIILCICILDDQNCFKKLHVESIESQLIDQLAKITDSESDQINGSLPDVVQHLLQTNTAFREEILMKLISASYQKSILSGKYYLTSREKEVLKLLIQGRSKKEISKLLFVSHNTIGTHINHIYHKLNVTNRASAVAKTLVEQLLP